MKPIKLNKNSQFLNILAMNYTSIKATAYVGHDGWSRDKRFRNIALENITFTFMGKEYILDHIWIQRVDMKDGTIYDHLGQHIEVICNFYQYRNDTTSNKCGMTIYRHRPVKTK